MVLIGYGIWRAGWHIWLPSPAEQEKVWTGSLFIYAGCALSLGAAVWSHFRGNPVWGNVCVGLPWVLVGWATLDDPYDLERYLAAVVAFPLGAGWRRRGHLGPRPPATAIEPSDLVPKGAVHIESELPYP